MKTNNIAIGTIFALGLSLLPTPAFAEEVVEEAPAVEEPGGWAVVDPDTGNVLNIIVCTQSVCGEGGEFGGRLEDAATGIVGNLVYQTPPNTGGYRSSEGTDVTWVEEQGHFEIRTESGNNGNAQTETVILTPGAPEGQGLSNIKKSTTFRDASTYTGERSVEAETFQEDLSDLTPEVSVFFPEWNSGTLFVYGTETEAEESLIDDILVTYGTEGIDLETENYREESVLNTIVSLAQTVVSWIQSIFGGENV